MHQDDFNPDNPTVFLSSIISSIFSVTLFNNKYILLSLVKKILSGEYFLTRDNKTGLIRKRKCDDSFRTDPDTSQ